MKKLWRKGLSVIEAEAPLRVDFVGMTDHIPAEGWCLNAAIDHPVARLRMEARNDRQVVIDAGSFGRDITYSLDQIGSSDDMFMKALEKCGYAEDFGMHVKVDCETGTGGLSSSSSVGAIYTVALLLAINKPLDPLEVAKVAQAIEPHWYGRQDQLSVSYGGINLWHMTPGVVEDGKVVDFGEIERYPIHRGDGKSKTLLHNFILYHSGIDGGAKSILDRVTANYASDPTLQAVFKEMNELAQEAYAILSCPDGQDGVWLQPLGEVFDRVREAHKKLHPDVTNERMEDLFEAAKKAGALGGRFSGAGGRGALTFLSKPGDRANVIAALNSVDTPYIDEKGRVYDRGNAISFNAFPETGARAWFLR